MKYEEHPFKVKVDAILKRRGGLYAFEDIVVAIQGGFMQSFTDGENWIVTQVLHYPRKEVLDVVFIVGEREALEKLFWSEVPQFAKERGIEKITGSTRVGLLNKFHRLRKPWKVISANYAMDVV